ncbi:hypothetical protein [Bacillus sp. JCM 19034]|uniref:hypothetical protein n=1 Tax=Bacillus sp. JCM 19034 TaxID=1481928 RepID=UPI000782D867|nr:hypothetical protein [Bacillus sp. JCM 19034]
MNMNGFARKYMTKNKTHEEFLMHVADVIERQLREWDESCEVYVMKMNNYELVVKCNLEYYHVLLSDKELITLQKQAPYELDRFIWRELRKKGLRMDI